MLQVFQLFQRKCECSFNIILAYFNIFHHSISTSFNRISTSFIIQISTYFNIISTSFIIQISTSFNIISTSIIIKNLNIFQHYFNMVTWLVSQVGWVTWLVSPGVAAAGCAGGFGAAVPLSSGRQHVVSPAGWTVRHSVATQKRRDRVSAQPLRQQRRQSTGDRDVCCIGFRKRWNWHGQPARRGSRTGVFTRAYPRNAATCRS